jgi:hypothetical protein
LAARILDILFCLQLWQVEGWIFMLAVATVKKAWIFVIAVIAVRSLDICACSYYCSKSGYLSLQLLLFKGWIFVLAVIAVRSLDICACSYCCSKSGYLC